MLHLAWFSMPKNFALITPCNTVTLLQQSCQVQQQGCAGELLQVQMKGKKKVGNWRSSYYVWKESELNLTFPFSTEHKNVLLRSLQGRYQVLHLGLDCKLQTFSETTIWAPPVQGKLFTGEEQNERMKETAREVNPENNN